jgi:hypothetical protein
MTAGPSWDVNVFQFFASSLASVVSTPPPPLTRDTYQSVLPKIHQKAGNDVAARFADKRNQRRRKAA